MRSGAKGWVRCMPTRMSDLIFGVGISDLCRRRVVRLISVSEVDHCRMSADELLDAEVSYLDETGEEVRECLAKVDVAALDRALPSRSFHAHRDQGHYSGLFWSSTTRTHVPFESLLEQARLWMADFDPSVIGIVAQPFRFETRRSRAHRRHVPDFLLTLDTGERLVVDVKPPRRAADPKVRALHQWTASLCRSVGLGYEVWTGADPIVLANIKFVAAARRMQVDPEELLPRLRSVLPAPFATAEQELSRAVLLALLWRNVVVADFGAPLSRNSVVRLGEGS